MSMSLFTIIQSEEDTLAHALHEFEQMARSQQQARLSARQNPPPVVAAASPAATAPANATNLPIRLARPETLRRRYSPDDVPRPQTSPVAAAPSSTAGAVELPYAASLVHPRSRNRSPSSRAQLRSRPVGAQAASQPMARAHSLPARTSSPCALSPQIGSASPLLRSPAHLGSPFRPPSPGGDYHPASVAAVSTPAFYDGGFETISEHAELDLTRSSFDRNISTLVSARPLSSSGRRSSPVSQIPPRRPSPSRSPMLGGSFSTPGLQGPHAAAPRFVNEAYPPPLHHSTSTSILMSLSMPGTPSSNRSRSPSISSLETIEDNPDLEWEAIEADRIARLKAAADAEDGGGGLAQAAVGSRRGGGGARKRWSVCGAERRADLDLETIWED